MASQAELLQRDAGWAIKVASAPAPAYLEARPWRECSSGSEVTAWDNLAAEASEPNPFYESWYLLPSLAALDKGNEAELLVLRRGARWLGLMPLVRPKQYYGRPFKHLGSWVHSNCFLGVPLVAKGEEVAFWRAILDWADRRPRSALFAHFSRLPLSGPMYDALVQVLAEQRRKFGVVFQESRAILQSSLSPEAYLEASMTGKKRKELRRQAARLAEEGDLTFSRQDCEKGLDGWCDRFLALEAAGWKGEAGSALACQTETAALFRLALYGAAQAGKLERLTLSLDGRPIAMLANFLTPPGSFSYKTAFDERFARFSPGVLLQRENLCLLERPGIEWSDSCASADHPMIDRIWRERREVGSVSLAIGGPLRRMTFSALLSLELGRRPDGVKR